MVVGLLHPGEMGAAIGAVLRQRGTDVRWASDGRSDSTKARAASSDLRDVGSVEELARQSDVILSVCPPHAATAVAASVGAFEGIYVDANAVSPSTAREIAATMARFVDGGVVGGPPTADNGPRVYLSGDEVELVAELFRGTTVDARIVSPRPGEASALKMVYSAWTKGSAALLLAVRETARAEGVEELLLAEWRDSIPGLEEQLASAERSAAKKGWRFAGEMDEIAATFGAAGEPDGFHRAAAAVYRKRPRP